MKSLPSIIVLAFLGALYFAPSESQQSPVAASALAPVASSFGNPLCDCVSCKCDNCTCGPLKVGKDVHETDFVDSGKPQESLAVQFTQPAPVPQVCPTLPKKAVAPAAGHWQSVQSCGRGGCSVSQVWVPNAVPTPSNAQSACANGSCGTRRGLFGRRR